MLRSIIPPTAHQSCFSDGLLGENRVVHEDLPYVSDSDRERLCKYALRKGDIVFSRVGSVDRRALVGTEEDGWLFSGRCLRVRPEITKLNPAYLSYFFGLPAFRDYISSIAVGATMPSLNTKILSDVPVIYPPLPEQRAIAHILGTLDDKIELNRRMNETLEEMARALFKSWFVDFDPVRAKMEGRWRPGESLPGLPTEHYHLFPDRLVDSELGEIPEGWEVKRMEDLAERIAMGPFGSSIKVSTFVNDGVPVISGQHLNGTILDDKEYRFITEEHAEKLSKANVQRGDVVFTHAGSTPALLGGDSWEGWEVDPQPAPKSALTTAEREMRAMGPFGSSIKVSTFVNDGVPVISGQHLNGTILDDKEYRFITEEHAEKLSKANVQRGDVVFTHAGSIGQVACIPPTSQFGRYVISQRQFYMRCDISQISPSFIVHFFKTPEGQHQLLANTSSTGVPSISRPVTYLRSIEICIPPKTLWRQFDEIADGLYLKAGRNTDEARTLAAQRDALLPKLVSGELRVDNLDDAVFHSAGVRG